MTDPLSTVFAALADPTRRHLLARLAEQDATTGTTGGATVGELADPLPISLPAVSRHLKVLREAGLIERQTDGQWRRCRLRPEALRPAADWIETYRPFWEGSFARLAAYLEAETDLSQENEGDPQ